MSVLNKLTTDRLKINNIYYWEQTLYAILATLNKAKALSKEYEVHIKHVEALKLLAQKEKQFHENLILINDLRRVISHRYVNK